MLNAQASLQVCVQESEIYSRHSLLFFSSFFFGCWFKVLFCCKISRETYFLIGQPKPAFVLGSMATQVANALNSLTRSHGVKVVPAKSVEECSLVVGDIVGHECMLAASRMNNPFLLFLSTVQKAN